MLAFLARLGVNRDLATWATFNVGHRAKAGEHRPTFILGLPDCTVLVTAVSTDEHFETTVMR